jgi:phosphatidate cytidylyltransferase
MINLKTLGRRSLTAVFFGIVVIFLLNFNVTSIYVFLLLVSFLTSYEYLRIKGSGIYRNSRLLIGAFVFGSAPMLIQMGVRFLSSELFIMFLSIIISYNVYTISDLVMKRPDRRNTPFTMVVEVLLYIGIPAMLFQYLQSVYLADFTRLLFVVIILIWVNDSFAYFVGSSIGRHKLMPSVSPGKTIEGFIGGVVFAIICAFILVRIYGYFDIWFYIILAIVASVIGTVGDLVESKLKRSHDIKDSGSFLPGHGGFLDRFDSFLFILPYVVVLGYLFLK